jgi:O-antigen biosynthesis protein
MDLSVIIISYNVRYFLEQCLISVMVAMKGIKGEVFVVDNCSSDDSCIMIETKFPGVRLIRNDVNRGFSAANNQALELSSGRHILLLNPDTIVSEDVFVKCLSFLDGHPDAGAVGIRMIDGTGRFLPESKRSFPTPATSFFRITGLWRLFPKSPSINRYYVGNIDEKTTAAIDVISGAFMLISRSAYVKAGKLDEDYFMYGEDIDYSYRLLKSGFSNYYFPDASIIHFKGESTQKGDLNVVVNFYKAMLIFVRKHLVQQRGWPLIFAVKTAIFFRASLSFVKRILRRLFFLDRSGERPEKKKLKKSITISGDDPFLLQNNLRSHLLKNHYKEIIFSLGDIRTGRIIEVIREISDLKLTVKYLSPDKEYMIGSGFASNNQPL